MLGLCGFRPDDAVSLAKSAQRNVTAECQMIMLAQKLALPLLPDLLDEAEIESAYAKLQKLIANGTGNCSPSGNADERWGGVGDDRRS